MTRAPRLDDRAVDWLQAGPEHAPDWVLAAAEAHARRHPRRHVPAWLSPRPAMVALRQLRDEESATASRLSRTWTPGAAAAFAVVLIVGAFAIGAGWGRGIPLGGGPSTSAGVPPATVAMSATCRTDGAPTATRSAGVTRWRGGSLRCTTTSTNDSLAGTATVFMSVDRMETGTGDAWGRLSIQAGEGSWSGPVSGVVDADGTEQLTGALFGAEAYAGMRILFTQSGTDTAFALVGTMDRADARAGIGDVIVRELRCSSGGDAGRESMDPDGVTHVEGRSMTCTTDASDPRLAGEVTLVASIEAQPDDSARISGTESLLTAEGAWLGTWGGTYDAGWSTHRWAGYVTGDGANAGLRYLFTTIGEWPRFVQVGTLVGGE